MVDCSVLLNKELFMNIWDMETFMQVLEKTFLIPSGNGI